jgi:hypothetical protein
MVNCSECLSNLSQIFFRPKIEEAEAERKMSDLEVLGSAMIYKDGFATPTMHD